ncbi:MAG: DNA repair protein RecO [Clostridiaceae bacterium]|nr:DNA repair protein RecO [Clostridiaceae bacterium]
MSYIKTKGIVIKEVNTGEADKIITVFSKDRGKMSCSAKGARRPKSRMSSGTQLLCYSEFVLFKGRDIFSINSCDVIESFYNIRNDVEKLTFAAHMTDIISDIIQENQPATKVLQLFLNSLYMLAKTDKLPEQIIRIFELRLLTIIGYAPMVRGCLNCGSDSVDNLFFSFNKCAFICGNCIKDEIDTMAISPGTAKTLNHIVYSNIKALFNFEVSECVLRELSRISKKYLKDRLEKEYRKLDFLKALYHKSQT